MRKSASAQFKVPRLDMKFENRHDHVARRYRGWLRPKASGCKRIRGLPAWVNTHAGRATFADQQRGAVFEAHRGGRRLGAGCSCWWWLLGRRLVVFVVVDPDASVVPVSL